MLAMFSALASLSHYLQYIIIDVQKCKGVCVCGVGVMGLYKLYFSALPKITIFWYIRSHIAESHA